LVAFPFAKFDQDGSPLGRMACALRGGSEPRDMALAVALGLLAGFIGGWNYSLLAVVLLAAIFNINGKRFAITWLAGAALAWLLKSFSLSVGFVLLDELRLGRLVHALGEGPILALFDWDRYELVGGAAIGLVLAAPVAWMTWGIAVTRKAHRASDCRVPSRLFRPAAWAIAPTLAIVGGLAPWWLGPQQVGDQVLEAWSKLNGAEVTAAKVELSLWTGEVRIEELQIANPADLKRDRLRIQTVEARLDPGPLLRGRLQIREAQIHGVECDVARQYPAKACGHPLPAAPLATTDRHQPGMDLIELHDYVRGWDRFATKLAWLQELIAAAERLASFDGGPQTKRGTTRSLEPVMVYSSTTRSNLGLRVPQVSVDRLDADGLPDAWGLGERSRLELTDLNSNPLLTERPAHVKLISPAWSADIRLELNVHQPGEPHRLTFTAYNQPLAELIEPAGAGRLAINNGLITLKGEGTVDAEHLDMQVEAEIEELSAQLAAPNSALGIDARCWNHGLAKLGGIQATAQLTGRWSMPRLEIGQAALVDAFRSQLREAGEHELVALIDDQLAGPREAPPRPQPRDQAFGTASLPSVATNDPRFERLPPVDDVATGAPAVADPVLAAPAQASVEAAAPQPSAAALDAVAGLPTFPVDFAPATLPTPASQPPVAASEGPPPYIAPPPYTPPVAVEGPPPYVPPVATDQPVRVTETLPAAPSPQPPAVAAAPTVVATDRAPPTVVATDELSSGHNVSSPAAEQRVEPSEPLFDPPPFSNPVFTQPTRVSETISPAVIPPAPASVPAPSASASSQPKPETNSRMDGFLSIFKPDPPPTAAELAERRARIEQANKKAASSATGEQPWYKRMFR
jgi:uncharacterized protein (TIGR03546 family)